MAHLLQHHIVPVLARESGLGAGPQPGGRVQLLRQSRPTPGVVDHLRAGELGHHSGHIIGKGQAVAQHEDAHGKNSFQRPPPSTARRASSVAVGKQVCTCRNTSSRERAGSVE